MKDVAQFLKALADEARLEILCLLFKHRELCVCDIMVALEITQSKASRHLATLRHAGLVVDRKEAAWSYYSLCPANSELERSMLKTLRTELGRHPGAARVLQRLQAQIERKDGKMACAADTTRASTTRAGRGIQLGVRGRAPLQGATR